jgi:hypothetical protein
MVSANADPVNIGSQPVDAIGYFPTKFLDKKIMHPHRFGIALRPPFPVNILEVSDKLLLLGIERYYRLLISQYAADACVDVGELRFPVPMAAAFAGFAVGLQTEFLPIEHSPTTVWLIS